MPPAIGFEMSTITDFTGFLGAAEIQGTAHGSDNTAYTFDADIDATFGFAGDYRICDASISFAASDDGTGIVYSSDPDGQTTVSAGIGLERNGVFFH